MLSVGLVVVLPGAVVVPVLPGAVVLLPGAVVVSVLPGAVEVLPDVVSEPDPVVDDPTELLAPGVPVDELVPMPVLVSVVPLDGLVVESLPDVDEPGLVVEVPLRGVLRPERPSGKLLREVELSVPIEPLPDDEEPTLPWSVPVVEPVVPVVEPVVPAELVSCPVPMDVDPELLWPAPELALGVPVVDVLDPVP